MGESMHSQPTAQPQMWEVRPWWDPDLAVGGFPPTSLYFETYWLPILGPAATLAMRQLTRGLDERPAGYEIDPVWLARRLGLGRSRSTNGPVARACERLCYFGLARRGDALEVRTHVPLLPRHLAKRLPPDLRKGHGEQAQERIQLPAASRDPNRAPVRTTPAKT